MNTKPSSPVRELRRFVPGIGWTTAATLQATADSPRCPPVQRGGHGGPMAHPGGSVVGEGKGTNKGKVAR